MHRAWKTVWPVVVALGVVVGIIAALASKDFRHVIRDAAESLYPGPLLIGLTVVVGGLILALAKSRRDHAEALTKTRQDDAAQLAAIERERDAALADLEHERTAFAEAKLYVDQQKRAHDERLFTETRRAMRRKVIRWVESQDFAAPWHPKDPMPFHELFPQRESPELVFNDEEIEARRKEFFDAAYKFITTLSRYSSHINENTVRVRPRFYESGQGDRYEREADELNELSHVVVKAYDAFIEAGRARGFDVLGD
jgi:hypothetical protein